MKIAKLILTMIAVGSFALPALANTLDGYVLAGHPHLEATAKSLKLEGDDWPEAEPSVIRHCLENLRKTDSKNPGRSLYKRLNSFDNCCARWTTVGSLKNQYMDSN